MCPPRGAPATEELRTPLVSSRSPPTRQDDRLGGSAAAVDQRHRSASSTKFQKSNRQTHVRQTVSLFLNMLLLLSIPLYLICFKTDQLFQMLRIFFISHGLLFFFSSLREEKRNVVSNKMYETGIKRKICAKFLCLFE